MASKRRLHVGWLSSMAKMPLPGAAMAFAVSSNVRRVMLVVRSRWDGCQVCPSGGGWGKGNGARASARPSAPLEALATLPMRMVPLRGMKVLSRRPSARRAAALVVLGVLLGSGAHWVSAASAESGPAGDSWDWEAYERQREAAHARLEASGEDTMYASTPSPPPAHPVHLPAPHQYVGATQETIQRVPSAFELAAASAAASDAEGGAFHAVPFLPTASDAARQGVVRVINHANESGAVEIHAVDDAGQRVGAVAAHLGRECGGPVQFGGPRTGQCGQRARHRRRQWHRRLALGVRERSGH